MKKRPRRWMVVAVVTLVMVTLCVMGGGRALEGGLHRIVEDSATQALGVGVTIETFALNLKGGTLTLGNLSIDNPPGYDQDKLLMLEQGVIHLDVSSLMSDRIEILSVSMKGMKVLWEQKGTVNNLQSLMDQLPDRDPNRTSSKSLHIHRLEIEGALVETHLLPVAGDIATVTLELPPIRLSSLGSRDALDLKGIIRTIVSGLLAQILEQGKEEWPTAILNPWRDRIHSGLEFLQDMKNFFQSPEQDQP